MKTVHHLVVLISHCSQSQTDSDGLKKQITSLQVTLQEAREENAARTEHEAKVTCQLQVGIVAVLEPLSVII